MADAGIAAVFLANRMTVRRLLAARTGDPAEADDIIQEMWVRLETMRIGPVGEPLAYLMRMALNLAADRQLAARRRLARDDAWVALQPAGADYPDAERSLASVEEWARLQSLLGAMPDHMHRALVLFRMEGRSQREIAQELGMSVSGVEKLLARAYRHLVQFREDTRAAAAQDSASGSHRPASASHRPASASHRNDTHD